MSRSQSKTSALGLVLLGALGLLALEAVIWGGWKLLCDEAEPPVEKVAAVADEQPAPLAEELPETEAGDEPPIRDLSHPRTISEQEAAAFGAKEVTPPEVEQPKEAASPPDEGRTPEELLEEKARESVDRLAQAEEDEELSAEKEGTFWAAHFDGYKKSIMEMIDGYFERPLDERLDYIMAFNRKLMKQIVADRESADMPALSKNPRQVNRQFMQLLGERMNVEEKKKLRAYVSDVMKMQQAMIEAQLGPLPEKQPPADVAEPEGETSPPQEK